MPMWQHRTVSRRGPDCMSTGMRMDTSFSTSESGDSNQNKFLGRHAKTASQAQTQNTIPNVAFVQINVVIQGNDRTMIDGRGGLS
jgi:hypothetical protein